MSTLHTDMRNEARKIRAVLFDLDGTLLDTAADLAAAANRMMDALALPRRALEEISRYVGKGITRLVERCLTGDMERRADPVELERAVKMFSGFYDEESGRHSRIYPGVLEGLRTLRDANVLLGCVTNKAARFTEPLLEQLGLAGYFEVVVSGDTVARAKPDPMPFAHACDRLGVRPEETAVIGDSANDVVAGKAAGCHVLCVPYGYREGRPVESLGCDYIVADVQAAAEYVLGMGSAVEGGKGAC
jgi:phosphoglycolate phosphatase